MNTPEEKKITVGEMSNKLIMEKPEATPLEIHQAQEAEYKKNLEWAVAHMKKKVDCSHLIQTPIDTGGHAACKDRVGWDGDFFVQVLLKKERLMDNVIRTLFMQNISCPTPDYDQSVFMYHAAEEKLQYLWTVPDPFTVELLLRNARYVVPEERPLLEMCMKFVDGTLLRKCRKLNGENPETGIVLEKKIKPFAVSE